MKITKYPDGTSYVFNTVNKPYTFRINTYEDLWHLHQFVDAFVNEHALKPIITIPNLIDAQADRRFNVGESFGLKLVLEFLNKLNANFIIFHPHHSEVVEASMNNVTIMDNSSLIESILYGYLQNDYNNRARGIENNLILMSSDAGGFKPLIKLCDKIKWTGETFSAAKARSWDGVNTKSVFTQQIDRTDFNGKDILIIDDICIYGGTFKGLSKLLKKRNCGKLYLAVSHMTVQNLGLDPVTNYFDKVFTTNSKYEKYIYQTTVQHHGTLDTLIHPTNLEIIKLFSND